MARNTRLAKMRDLFRSEGFNFHKEFIKALEQADPQTKLEALVSVAPFFMERLRPEPEVEETAKDVTPEPPKSIAKASDAELLKVLESRVKLRDDQE